jgi:Lon protease-like protein
MLDLLPLFPLPNVVLFPNVFLPLHIFEIRYREMVAQALATDRLIGMVLLRPGWEGNYEGQPPVFPVGCNGVITHVESLPDGRYHLVLRGLDRFRIIEEDPQRSYRRALVEPLADPEPGVEDRAAIKRQRTKLEALLAPAVAHAGADPHTAASMSDGDLIHALAQYLDLEPLEKQALLETDGLRQRAESLVELLEMKVMMSRIPGASHVSH